MQIDLSAHILDLDGKAVDNGKPLTLSQICCVALLAPQQPNETQTAEQKVKQFTLAMKITDGEEEFSVEEIALLKTLIGKFYPPLVVGRAYEILDPQPRAIKAVRSKSSGLKLAEDKDV